jgi:hypothetical protein
MLAQGRPLTSHLCEMPEFLRITDNANAGDLAAGNVKGQH